MKKTFLASAPTRFLVSILSGFLLTAAYAPFNVSAAGLLAIFLLVAVWWRCPRHQAFWNGYAFGLAHFGSGVYWIYYSLHDFGEAHVLFAAGVTVLFVLLLAIYFAVFAWCAVWGRGYLSALWFHCLWFPSLWVGFEWLRSVLFSGFAWNLLGQSWVDFSWFGLFPWFGILGVSWVIAFVGAGIHLVVVASAALRFAAVVLIALVLGAGVAAQSKQWTQAVGPPVKVGIVQSGIEQTMKFDRAWFKEIVARHYEMTSELTGRDLIVWAETAIPSVYHAMASSILMPIYDQFIRGRSELLAGLFYYDQENKSLYNSVVKVGDTPEFYHKQHLVPFGEYVPLRFLLKFFHSYVTMPMSDLVAGKTRGLFSVGEHQLGLSICYEVIFADEMRQVLPQANYLVNVSNDSWFGHSSAAYQHLQMARVRTRELERAMVRATSTGISALIDHQGNLLNTSEMYTQQNLSGEIQARTGTTLFARYGHRIVLVYIMALLAICLVIVAYRWREKHVS